jgi:hypothetical protein
VGRGADAGGSASAPAHHPHRSSLASTSRLTLSPELAGIFQRRCADARQRRDRGVLCSLGELGFDPYPARRPLHLYYYNAPVFSKQAFAPLY